MSGEPGTLAVAVAPVGELKRRRALFAALEEAFPVRFQGHAGGSPVGCDAAIELAGGPAAAGMPALSLLAAEPGDSGPPRAQTLADSPSLDLRLRGAVLPDSRLAGARAAGASLGDPEAATVLARDADGPTWVRSGERDAALMIPAELGDGEALRERLCEGRSAALLPLVHFLRELTAELRWRPPPPRASLLFDDPNLHWPSYGFIRLPELGEHARAHGYHVALAMVPLDARFAHPGAVRAVSESGGAISLLCHGNDHNGPELGQLADEVEGLTNAAQALRRIAAFEHRTGLSVDRVMVPPHEQCSAASMTGLRRCGFAAITMTRPFPWLAHSPQAWLARPPAASPLIGWQPADFAGTMPVLLRHPLATRDAPELVLRAFLDQPLILYGHHDDVADGLDPLATAAEDVNRLQPTRWCSLGEIAASSFETRQDGSQLALRAFGRSLELAVPPGVEELTVSLPGTHPGPAPVSLSIDGVVVDFDEPVGVSDAATVSIEIRDADAVDPGAVPPPRRRPLAPARRAFREGRDRLLPLLPKRG